MWLGQAPVSLVPADQPAEFNEVQEIVESREMVEIPEEVEVAPEPVAVDPNRPLRRKKT